MPIQTDWLVENQVYYVYIHHDITLEEYREMILSTDRFFQATDHPTLHIFAYLNQVGKFPLDLRAYQELSLTHNMSRMGWVVIVGRPNAFVSFLVSVLGQLMGYKFRLFSDIEAGMAFLNEQDDLLPPLIPLLPDFLKRIKHDSSN